MLGGIWTIIVSILVFAVMIAIHEFGHFSAAKLFGIRVNQFAIGMGPVIWKKQGKETLYSLRAIPMGGFCQMEGEDAASDDERSFGKAAWWKRFIVVIAGATLNIVLGFVIFLILQAPVSEVNTTVIDSIDQTTNLSGSAFAPGDEIVKLDNTTIHIYEDLRFFLDRVTDKPVEVTARRGGETITQTITPVKQDIVYTYTQDTVDVRILHNGTEVDHQTHSAPDTAEYQDYVGKSGTQTSYILGFVPKAQPMTFTTAISRAFYLTIYNIKIVYISLYELIRGNVPATQVSGPVGIISVIGQASQMDWTVLFNLVGLLTVNLGIMNLLPIPALDGCKLLIILIEAITRRRLPPEKEGIITLIGFALLIMVLIWATYNDVVRLFTGWQT